MIYTKIKVANILEPTLWVKNGFVWGGTIQSGINKTPFENIPLENLDIIEKKALDLIRKFYEQNPEKHSDPASRLTAMLYYISIIYTDSMINTEYMVDEYTLKIITAPKYFFKPGYSQEHQSNCTPNYYEEVTIKKMIETFTEILIIIQE